MAQSDYEEAAPFIVTAKGLMAAVALEGPYKGFPLGLIQAINSQGVSIDEVKRRGWVYQCKCGNGYGGQKGEG